MKLEAILTGLLSYHLSTPTEQSLFFIDFISKDVPIFAKTLSGNRGGFAKRLVRIVPAA